MKAELRKKIKLVVSNLTNEEKQSKSIRASELFEAYLSNTTSDKSTLNVGLYAALNDELDCKFIDLFSLIHVSYPAIEDDQMVFKNSRGGELVESIEFGVKLRTPRDSAHIVTPDLILIPGRAFTKEGARLGRGKGYYDKYLENYNGIKIGLCFNEQLLKEIPMDPHDQYMDFVLTDKELVKVAK